MESSPKILIRADASAQIGTGHVMRCLTLADELRRRGAEVSFICRNFDGNLCGYIEKKGHMVYCLPVSDMPYPKEQNIETCFKHAAWLGTDWQTDARQVEQIIRVLDTTPDWLVADHYALDERWEGALRPYVKKIMVIDDLADRVHDCDLLLDQNYYEKLENRYDGLVPSDCKKLLGPKYALLRPEFRKARKNLRKRDGHIKRIMIFFGGSDPTNATEKALEAIRMLNRPDIAVDVVVGTFNPHHKVIEQIASDLPDCICHFNVEDMAVLMAGADLAVGAGGTTVWERCTLALPSIVMTVAGNQKRTVSDMAESGYLLSLGHSESVSVASICHALQISIQSPELLIFFIRKIQSLVDGKGAKRTAQKMLTPEIRPMVSDLKPFNILVTSISRKVPLLKSVRKAAQKIIPGVKIYGGDINSACIGKYFTDYFWPMPPLSKLTKEGLLAYCQYNNIRCIIPTRDGELLFWAQNRPHFVNAGIDVVVSPVASIQTCFDKYAFAQFGKAHGFSFIPTGNHPDEIGQGSYVVKERYGAGSQKIGLNLDRATALEFAQGLDVPIYQPFIIGKEISIDAWLDRYYRVKGLVMRTRDRVLDGESQVTTTFKNGKIETMAMKILHSLKLRGPVVMQAIIDAKNNIHIIECNTRFGGASTTSIAAGLDIFYWSLLESHGVDVGEYPFNRLTDEVRQVRIPSDFYIYGNNF